MKEIVHLSSVHIADDTRIYRKMCSYLINDGWNVTLIARRPENKLNKRIQYIPFPEYPGKLQRMVFAPLVMLRMALKTRKKRFQIHDPELISTGLILKLLGKKVILDVHEHYVDQIEEKDYARPLQKKLLGMFVRTMEKWAGIFFDQIITVVPRIQKLYPEHKCTLVQNFAIRDELSGADAGSGATDPIPFYKRQNLIYYVGSITAIRGVGEVIDAMDRIPDRYQARFILAGPFGEPHLLDEYKAKPGWKKVEYAGFQSRDAIRETLSRAKAGVVTLHPVKQYIGAQSIKMFEYMSAGLPVIATDMPMMNSIIHDSGAGLLVKPFDIEMLTRAIISIFDDPEKAEAMGEAGRRVVQERYNWESQYLIYRGVLEKM